MKGVIKLDDVTKSNYAEWLEELIQNVMEHQPEKIGVCMLLPDANCAISVMWRVIEEGGAKCEE